MRITDVDVIPVKGRHWPRFPMIFVEVHTDAGLTGLGEALPYQATGVVESLRELGEALEGADPFRIQALWERFCRRGAHMPALSALKTAMRDLAGQALGAPIHSLLGGACREEVHVYADGFFREGEPTPQRLPSFGLRYGYPSAPARCSRRVSHIASCSSGERQIY